MVKSGWKKKIKALEKSIAKNSGKTKTYLFLKKNSIIIPIGITRTFFTYPLRFVSFVIVSDSAVPSQSHAVWTDTSKISRFS